MAELCRVFFFGFGFFFFFFGFIFGLGFFIYFFNAMLMWKIVKVSKVSVLYIYIYIDERLNKYYLIDI